ncbi:AgmX/PglI C-terminal domain-containing protein [Psychrobium sp. MM17-31]|uniref:AgmX/PglI C-terminal domain-containing protein n=1 Tax=Psychrobium sp. MM17-31 TaxID=2917758 RepID=UPI001EF6CA79|nr:AgmX/PglI C-terminal domain-containing protein [Psychrobium sp. MM17-31]MCG7529884.1 AgmX/PglI C-terminal domain-containing protein [Psychrobium sp. MM17-31]
MAQVNANSLTLSHWGESRQENKLFTQITWLFLIVTVVLAVVVKVVTVPELTREEKAKIPPQLTKFIERVKIEEKPKPTPVEEKPEEVKEEPKPVEKPKPEPKPPEPKPIETQEQRVEKAREQAKQAGLLAMQDDLAQLREIAKMTTPTTTEPLSTQGQQAAVTDTEPKSEAFVGGAAQLDNSKVSQTVGKRVELTSRDVTTVAAAEVPEQGSDVSVEQEQAASGGRDVESIRKVLDRNKGAFYTIYRRALRKDPSLEGKVEMLIVVAPNGRVSDCRILSSELKDPALEKKLLARVKLINFGAQNVEETSINYSFNFLPF